MNQENVTFATLEVTPRTCGMREQYEALRRITTGYPTHVWVEGGRMKNRGFSLIHIADLIRRIRARIELHRSLGDEAGARTLELFLREFEG